MGIKKLCYTIHDRFKKVKLMLKSGTSVTVSVSQRTCNDNTQKVICNQEIDEVS